MAATLNILAGPAGSGKTERLLGCYRNALRAGPIGGGLWLTPTARAGRALRERLLNAELPACLRPGISTFAQFAEAILQQAGKLVRPITDWQKRELLERLVRAALPQGKKDARKERLKYFTPIAETEGFLDQLTSFVSELKRLEIWPEHFYDACERRGWTEKDSELFRLYDQYQKLLRSHALYDREGRFWEARELLKNDGRRCEQLRFVVVDGFTDFTRTQHEMLEQLSERAAAVWISLPLERDSERADLFGKTERTLQELQRRHPGAKVEWTARRTPAPWPALDHIERYVFGDPRKAKKLPDSHGLEILAAARQDGEIEVVGRRIKKLLLSGDGDVNEAVHPGDVLVVFRNVAEIAPLVREIFTRLGVPFVIEATRQLRESPSLRVLAALLRLSVEDWPFRQVLAVAGNSLLQWTACLPAEKSAVIAATQRLVRKMQIHQGAERLLERLSGLADREVPDPNADAPNADEAAEIVAARYAVRLLRSLYDGLAALPKAGTPAEWANSLQTLVDTFGLSRDEREQAAWKTFWTVFEESADLSKLLNEEPPQWTPAEVLEQVEQLLTQTPLPGSSDEAGCVRVLSAQSVRALSAPHVFLAGLSEKAFPPGDADTRLYADAEYRALNEHGLNLVDRTQRSQEEMLLFYEALTRGTKRLYLSYPALDEKAQPLSASPYLNEVETACGEGRLTRQQTDDLTPTAHVGELLCGEDWRLLAVAAARANVAEGADKERGAKLLAGLLQGEKGVIEGTAIENLCAGLKLVQARGTGLDFGPYEGMLTSDAVRKQLADRFGPTHCWSVSQLEEYASCPHKFYLHRVLNLRPLSELSLDLDWAERGTLLHDVLAALHRKLNAAHGGPVAPGAKISLSALAAQFTEIVDECVQRLRGTGALADALVEVNRRSVLEWGPKYAAQSDTYHAAPDPTDMKAKPKPPLAPAYFEVAFGKQKGETVADGISKEEPYELTHDGESVKLAGRIDRIDVGKFAGQTLFNVVDYKTGKSTALTPDMVKSGAALQLPLYAIVAQEMLLLAEQATPWQIGYWFVKEKGFTAKPLQAQEIDGGALRTTKVWDDLKKNIAERVVSAVRGIRTAQFPMACEDEKCTSLCDYHTVCRVQQVRALHKAWQSPLPQNPS